MLTHTDYNTGWDGRLSVGALFVLRTPANASQASEMATGRNRNKIYAISVDWCMYKIQRNEKLYAWVCTSHLVPPSLSFAF
jgi:hypothetical protein